MMARHIRGLEREGGAGGVQRQQCSIVDGGGPVFLCVPPEERAPIKIFGGVVSVDVRAERGVAGSGSTPRNASQRLATLQRSAAAAATLVAHCCQLCGRAGPAGLAALSAAAAARHGRGSRGTAGRPREQRPERAPPPPAATATPAPPRRPSTTGHSSLQLADQLISWLPACLAACRGRVRPAACAASSGWGAA